MAGMTGVSAALAHAAGVLAAAGVPSPRTDAELLAAYVLGVPRGRLVLADGFDPAQLDRFEQLVTKRVARVPLQHLTGSVGFGGLELAVGPGVFVPRPETELLAQWAVAQPARVVVDLCAGSGALALVIADRLPSARVYAVERAPEALHWLRRNAADRARAGDRPIDVVAGDLTDPMVLAELDGTVDLVVCNPPYVPDTRAPAPGVAPAAAPWVAPPDIPPEVARYEPSEAVFAGPDGLSVIRPVIARAAALLRPGGRFGLEHDETQAAPVLQLLGRRFEAITDHRDLAGRPRFATAIRVAD